MADELTLTQQDFDDKIAAAVKAAVDGVQGNLDKLKGKNTDLLDELKKSRQRVKDFEGFDADEVKLALQKAKDGERNALEEKGEYEKALNLANQQHADEVKTLKADLDAAQGEGKTLRVTTALDKALDKIKVPAHFKPAVLAMHQGNVSVIEKDGKKVAVIGEKPVADFLTGWAETDEGKHFVGDGGNSGGGAAGGSTGDTGGQNPWAKDTRNLTLQGIMERDNPGKAEKLKREAGVAA